MALTVTATVTVINAMMSCPDQGQHLSQQVLVPLVCSAFYKRESPKRKSLTAAALSLILSPHTTLSSSLIRAALQTPGRTIHISDRALEEEKGEGEKMPGSSDQGNIIFLFNFSSSSLSKVILRSQQIPRSPCLVLFSSPFQNMYYTKKWKQ